MTEKLFASVQTNISKQYIDLSHIVKHNAKEIRRLHFRLSTLRKTTADEETDEGESLSEFIPCTSYRELQDLDEKLRSNRNFFEEGVRVSLRIKTFLIIMIINW